jgi:hypothetical protein
MYIGHVMDLCAKFVEGINVFGRISHLATTAPSCSQCAHDSRIIEAAYYLPLIRDRGGDVRRNMLAFLRLLGVRHELVMNAAFHRCESTDCCSLCVQLAVDEVNVTQLYRDFIVACNFPVRTATELVRDVYDVPVEGRYHRHPWAGVDLARSGVGEEEKEEYFVSRFGLCYGDYVFSFPKFTVPQGELEATYYFLSWGEHRRFNLDGVEGPHAYSMSTECRPTFRMSEESKMVRGESRLDPTGQGRRRVRNLKRRVKYSARPKSEESQELDAVKVENEEQPNLFSRPPLSVEVVTPSDGETEGRERSMTGTSAEDAAST